MHVASDGALFITTRVALASTPNARTVLFMLSIRLWYAMHAASDGAGDGSGDGTGDGDVRADDGAGPAGPGPAVAVPAGAESIAIH